MCCLWSRQIQHVWLSPEYCVKIYIGFPSKWRKGTVFYKTKKGQIKHIFTVSVGFVVAHPLLFVIPCCGYLLNKMNMRGQKLAKCTGRNMWHSGECGQSYWLQALGSDSDVDKTYRFQRDWRAQLETTSMTEMEAAHSSHPKQYTEEQVVSPRAILCLNVHWPLYKFHSSQRVWVTVSTLKQPISCHY